MNSGPGETVVLRGSPRHVASLFLLPVAVFGVLGWRDWSSDRAGAWIAIVAAVAFGLMWATHIIWPAKLTLTNVGFTWRRMGWRVGAQWGDVAGFGRAQMTITQLWRKKTYTPQIGFNYAAKVMPAGLAAKAAYHRGLCGFDRSFPNHFAIDDEDLLALLEARRLEAVGLAPDP